MREQVGLGAQHGHGRAQLVGGVLHEGAFALQLLAQSRQQPVKGDGQGLELVVLRREAQGRQVLRIAPRDGVGELVQRPHAAPQGDPQRHHHERERQQQRADQLLPEPAQHGRIAHAGLGQHQRPAAGAGVGDPVRRRAGARSPWRGEEGRAGGGGRADAELDIALEQAAAAAHLVELVGPCLHDEGRVARVRDALQRARDGLGQQLHAGSVVHAALELGEIQHQQCRCHQREGQQQRAEHPAQQRGPRERLQPAHHGTSW